MFVSELRKIIFTNFDFCVGSFMFYDIRESFSKLFSKLMRNYTKKITQQ